MISYTTVGQVNVKKWIEIPYPAGFNSSNSLIIPVSIGSEQSWNVTVKINYNKQYFSVIGINDYIYTALWLIFIKCNIN